MTNPAAAELDVQAPTIPEDVLTAYSCLDAPSIEQMSGGEINATWLITGADGQRLIVQRLSPIFGEEMINDMVRVTSDLEEQGWEMPVVVATAEGQPFTEDASEGKPYLWRATTFIDSDGAPEQADEDTHFAYGTLLARLHGSLARIEHEPGFKLADGNFHKTDFYVNKLRLLRHHMPDAETSRFASDILNAYDHLPPLPEGREQLIHGDPRTDNMLFRDGQPFTYIDWDTIMKGSIWVDVGDLMRSLIENGIQETGVPPAVDELFAFSEGYRRTAMPYADPDEFFGWTLTATRRIALELATRYINDVVEDCYWVWDASRFASRRDSNVDRASTQWKIYNAYKDDYE